MPAPAPVLIAGGGIGGLALALALARRGRPAVVLEQRTDFATEGAGIQLGPNGVRVLQRLGVAPALARMVGVPECVHLRAGRSGRTLARLPLDWLAARHGAPYWVAHRADVHAALSAAARMESSIALRTGFAVASCEDTGTLARATASDGSSAHGAALIGADGLWSRVRAAICPAHPALLPHFVGATATRTVIAASDAGLLAAREVGVWLTPAAHIVHYPVRGGTEIAVVVIAREAWQSRAWDVDAGAQLPARLAGFHAGIVSVLARAPRWRKWALHALPPLPRWTAGRIALMGDAAHPMLPYLAQGGVLALEDAEVLAGCLAGHSGEEARALARFESLRRDRAARAQAASRRQGRIYHLAPPLAWLRDAVLRRAPPTSLLAGLDWLYGWRGDDP